MSQTYLLQNLPTNITNGYREQSEFSSLFDNLKLSGGGIETQEGGLFKKDPAKEAEKKKKKDLKKCENYDSTVDNLTNEIIDAEEKESVALDNNKPRTAKRASEKRARLEDELNDFINNFSENNEGLDCEVVIAEKKAEEDAKREQIQNKMDEEKRKKEQALINDNITEVFHTVARSNTPFWCSNLGITILTIFFGYSYQILINNEDFLMWAIWGFGLIFIILFRIGVGLLRRGNILEKKIRHSYTALLSVYVMIFFVAYWTYQLYNPSDEDKKPCNKNASWNKKFSIFMSILYGFLIFSSDIHLSRYCSKDVKKGSIIGLLFGLGAFGGYYAIINK